MIESEFFIIVLNVDDWIPNKSTSHFWFIVVFSSRFKKTSNLSDTECGLFNTQCSQTQTTSTQQVTTVLDQAQLETDQQNLNNVR